MPSLAGPCREPLAGGAPDALVVLLHGIGANGEDLIGLADALAPRFPRAAFHAPDAPHPYAEAGFGYQWFPREPEPARLDGVRAASEVVNAHLDGLLDALGLDSRRCVLIGFSQGCMAALHAAPRMERRLAGVVGFSGALLDAETLPDKTRSKPPFLLAHGSADIVVPPTATAEASQTLDGLGFEVEAHILPGLGHGIDERGLELAAQFMERVLGAA